MDSANIGCFIVSRCGVSAVLACLLTVFGGGVELSANEVLIYYANENAPEGVERENFDTFAKWLRELDTERTNKMAAAMLKDTVAFPEAVDEELASLSAASESGELGVPVVVFTNRLARKNRCRVLSPGTSSREERFDFEPSGSLVLNANPLCRLEVFAAALSRVAELFPPNDHRFVLITKSHGSEERALTVRLQHDFRTFSKEKLASLLEDPDSTNPQIVGISKQQYFETLEIAGSQNGMEFSLVFIESCRGIFDASTVSRFPRNIELLYASGDRYLQYQTLDYPQLIESSAGSNSISPAFEEQLREKYLAIHRTPRKSKWWALLWFVPAILFACLWYRRWARNSTARLGRKSEVPAESR